MWFADFHLREQLEELGLADIAVDVPNIQARVVDCGCRGIGRGVLQASTSMPLSNYPGGTSSQSWTQVCICTWEGAVAAAAAMLSGLLTG